MTLVREYQPTFVLGDGETKEFSYLFEEVSENFIKVIVKHDDGSTYNPVYSVDLDSHKVVFGESETAPLDTDIICIYRETPDLQDTPFRTLQGYDARALENILTKIVAMIQELKANGFSTQILQGYPWQLDLLNPDDDAATVVIDYNARILKKGLYFQIVSGNLQVSADGNSFIKMPKSADITEFRRLETVLEDLTVQYRLQYKVDGVWYNAESNAESTADEALQIAQEAKDLAQDASDTVGGFADRLTIAEQDSSEAKGLAQDASDAVSAHVTDTNNPHSVTAAQVGALPNTTKYGAALSLTINSTTYVVTAQLKDQDGNNLGTAQTIDLPLESVVISGAYDSVTKEVVLTLQDGSKIRFSVADLVSGLQTEITALNMLSADLVDDTSTTHKFVTTTEKSTWNGKQDAISDLATIRSGASAGATAVQPGNLATVATSGLYSDLTETPTIPATLATLTGDVNISNPTDGQHLVYDENDQKWKNESSAATVSWGGVTGTLSDQTDLQNALDAKADVATTYNKTEVDALLTALIRPGTVFPFAGLTTPNGYLVCDGSAVSRTTYADLFNAIGTYYGDGDGSTTFNLPNFMNGYPLSNGSSSDISNGLVTASASLPNITGNFNAYTYNTGNPSGAFGASIQTAKVLNSGSQNNLNINTFSFSAGAISGRYSRTDGLVYPTRNILRGGWIIKY